MSIEFRKAIPEDIEYVAKIYDKIHEREEKGQEHVGWKRGVYPVKSTAEKAFAKGELFVEVMEEAVVGTAILNQAQVDVYENAPWRYEVPDNQVMVMHTLVIDPDIKGQGLGRAFAEFYEKYAVEQGAPYLRIDTNERNENARRFYKKLGYNEIAIVPCVFNGIEGVNLVLLEKKAEQEMTSAADL